MRPVSSKPRQPVPILGRAVLAVHLLAGKAILGLLPKPVDRDQADGLRSEILATLESVLRDSARHSTVLRLIATGILELASLIGLVLHCSNTMTNSRFLIPQRNRSLPMRTLLEDFRQAAKSLARRPAYSLVAILILAIGIGAGTAIFSVLDPVLLRPESFDKERTLVTLWQELEHTSDLTVNGHPIEAVELYRAATTLEGVATYTGDTAALFDGHEPLRVHTAKIDHTLLPLLRTEPILGRNFSADESEDKLVLIHEGLWQENFGADPNVVGRTIDIDDVAYQIIGVLPSEFTFPDAQTRLWMPISGHVEDRYHYSIVARLARNVAIETAQEEIERLAKQAKADGLPVLGKVVVKPQGFMRQYRIGQTAVWFLLGAVMVLLLTACANTTNLALTQATSRRTELTIRRALGATRHRVVRLLLAESVLLSLAAATVGSLLATISLPMLLRVAPEGVRLPVEKQAFLDWRILLFTAGISFVAAAATGMLPSLRAVFLTRSHHRTTDTRAARRTGTALATVQVTMTFVLLFTAGLLLRSFEGLVSVDPGFKMTNVLAIDLSLDSDQYKDQTAVEAYYETVEQHLEQLPFVSEVTTASGAPPRTSVAFGLAPQVEGEEPIVETPSMSLPAFSVAPDYFRLLQIPLIEGSTFDRRAGQDQVVINQALAQRLFEGQKPVGQRIRLSEERPWLVVTGIVTDIKPSGPKSTFGDGLEAYFPFDPKFSGRRTLMIKSTDDPWLHLDDIKGILWQVDERIPLYRIRSLEEEWAGTMAKPKFLLRVIGLLASLTLLLTLAGMYAVLSYSVSRRRREIGVRMALGGRARSIVWLMLRQGAVAGGIGIVAGSIVALFGAGFLQQELFEVSTTDSTVLLTVTALTVLTVVVAAWLPASHATKVQPAETLRSE